MEITAKHEICVPFAYIGEAGWEEGAGKLLAAHYDYWGDDPAKPVTEALLAKTEARLAVKLPDALKLFYTTFGVADIGEELQDPQNMEFLSEWAAGMLDEEGNPEDVALASKLVTFSEYLGNGNAFCFHVDTHEVYYFDHETEPYISQIFPKVDDYFRACLVKLQEVFLAPGASEEMVEEKLIEMYGEETIVKWLY